MNKVTEAVILAGGQGMRLRSIVDDRPKPMALILGKPFLEILLNFLQRQGIRRVIMSTGYMSEKILSHFGNKFNEINLFYSIEKAPLGTGGGLKKSLLFCETNYVLAINGDTYNPFPVDKLAQIGISNEKSVIVSKKIYNPGRYSSLEVQGHLCTNFNSGVINQETLVNTGSYLLRKDIFEECILGDSFSFENEFIGSEVIKNKILVYKAKGDFIDIGIPEDYIKAQTYNFK